VELKEVQNFLVKIFQATLKNWNRAEILNLDGREILLGKIAKRFSEIF
jgi:hypothetical protein